MMRTAGFPSVCFAIGLIPNYWKLWGGFALGPGYNWVVVVLPVP